MEVLAAMTALQQRERVCVKRRAVPALRLTEVFLKPVKFSDKISAANEQR